MKIKFYNKGQIDESAFTMMGVSVKQNETAAIGQFGTGLKYAIAGILRTGGEISIKTRDENSSEILTYTFDTGIETIRGKDFEVIYCNGKKLSYCTDYGKHWEPWQWFRELHSNALDEGGSSTNGKIQADTVITVKHQSIEDCYHNRASYFLSTQPIWENDEIAIHAHTVSSVFYKGVKVHDIKGDKSMFTYNIKKGLTLTEDRTLKYDWEAKEKVGKALSIATLPVNLRMREEFVTFSYVLTADDTILDAIQEDMMAGKPVRFGKDSLHKRLRGDIARKTFTPTKKQLVKLDRAKAFLKEIGFEIVAPINFVESAGDQLFGFAQDGEIWLTEKAFDHGTHDLVQTVLEEHMHLVSGHSDETREFQQYLFRQLVNLGEEIAETVL